MDVILLILMFILGLLILITLHELGHFIFAKIFNVYCFEFSICFGKKVIRRKKKYSETFFCVGVIPLGGYVAMLGEDDDETEKNKKLNEKAAEANLNGEQSLFTVIERKEYKVYKKQEKLLKKHRELISKNHPDYSKEQVEEEAINTVLGILKRERLVVEEDFYSEVDEDNLPKNRSLEKMNRGKKACVMAAGITMNFIVGFLLYLVSYGCFPLSSVSGIVSFSTDYKVGETSSTFVDQVNELKALLPEDETYVLEGDYVMFENDLLNKNFTLDMSIGKGVINDGDKKENIVATINNEFQFADLSIDNQLYRVNKNVKEYNFYSIIAEGDFTSPSWTKYYNDNKEAIEKDEQLKEFFKTFEEGKLNHKEVTLISSKKYQTIEGARIDSVELEVPLMRAKINPNVDAGFEYIEGSIEEDISVKGTLNMKVDEKGAKYLEKTYLSFTGHERWLSAGEVFTYAGKGFADGTTAVFKAVGGLIVGKGWESVGGPIALFTQSSAIFKNNPFSVYLKMWGLISVNLAVMNLLPIPGLDGWHLLVTGIEAITRRKLPAGFKKWAARIGLICLYALMAVIIVVDVIRCSGVL